MQNDVRSTRKRPTGAAGPEAQAPPDSAQEVIAAVLAQAIAAVQSQQVPAEQAINAAMESVGETQRAALDLMLHAARAQAGVVQQLLANAPAATLSLGTEVGALLRNAVEHGPELIDTVATGLTQWLRAVASPSGAGSQQDAAAASEPPVATPTADPQAPPATTDPSPTEQPATLETILQAMADGYSSGQSGAEVAQTIRARYPAAIPSMQKYLAMSDFLVLMWLRQQPALSGISAEERFPRFYAEFKEAML